MKKSKLMIAAAVILIIVFVTVSLVGCGPSKQAVQKVRLSEVIHSMFYAPQYVALHKGFFKEEGLDVEINTAWGSDKGATAVISGSADIALAGPETTIYLYNQGASNYLIAFAQLTAKDGSFLLARQPMLDFKWQDVKGKTIIGGRKGGMPEMVLEYILKQAGITPQVDTQIIQNIALTATAGAFKGGTGDFLQLFEPNVSLLEKEKVGYVVASMGIDGGPVPYTAYLTTAKYIKDNPYIIQKFTNAIYKAQLWVYSHSPEEIAETIAPSFPEIEKDVLIKAVERYMKQETWTHNPIFKQESFEHMQDIILSAGELKARAPYDKLVNTTFAEKAVKAIKATP